MRSNCILLLSVLVAIPLVSQSNDSGLKWVATPIAGLEMAVASGDPGTQGNHELRFRAKEKVRVPPHWHASDAQVAVLAGSVAVGEGERFEASSLRVLRTGQGIELQKGVRYFAVLEKGTEVQLESRGPFAVEWVDPSALKSKKLSDVDSASERSKMKAEQDKR